jgi:DNA helicase-2/ATP-dependent DNA helicase PcrA
MTFPPTPEQSAILSAVRDSTSNIMIRARAGCGKTSTLELIDRAETKLPYLLICFNKTIAAEAKLRMRPSTTVKTFNGLGHSIWGDFCGKKLKLNPQKILQIYREIVDDADKSERKHLWSLYDAVKSAVDMARSLGYIPDNHAKASKRLVGFNTVERHLDETLLAEARGLVDKILVESIRLAYDGSIDFNDQVYMPALFGGLYPTFPVVLIDEYQDLSPVNRAMVGKLCRHSRQIGVGDEAQAIYEFRGADADAMPKAIEEFGMQVLPLSTSFRCPEAITSNVHWHVPDIRSFSPGGIVETSENFSIQPNSAVICRYNAPLLKLAMELLSSGHKVDVAGVDIGNRVIKLLTKLGDESLSQAAVLSAIADWQAERESLDSKSAADTADCLRVFARHGRTLGTAIAYAKHIFESSTGEIRFMSGHRSKGLEFDHVYHLNSSSIGPGGQEPNIYYVIDTRPKSRLTYIEMER